ncbi:MAG: hypothetical protein Q7T82_20255 [Armatimonadota bacterium]|nr:hypothetical protein [Armatimonadota bacterium]
MAVCAILLLAGQANAVRFYDSGSPDDPVWRYLASGEGLAQSFTVSGAFELDSASFGAVSEDGHALGTFALYTGIGAPTEMIGSWEARIDKESPQDMIRWTNTSVHDRIVLTSGQTYWAALIAPLESSVKVAMHSSAGNANLAWYVPDAWNSAQFAEYGPATLRLWGNELRIDESVPEPASFAILTGGMAVLGVIRRGARRRRART